MSWEHIAQHSTWYALGRAWQIRQIALRSTSFFSFFFFTRLTCMCVWSDEHSITQCEQQQTVAFDCADCPLVGDAWLTRRCRKKMTL